MSLQSILDSTLRDTAELAQLLFDELPVRYAQRIKMLESLPDWHRRPEVNHVRQMYVSSFKELRLVDPRDPLSFQNQLRSIKRRHSHTNLLVSGFRKYAEEEQLDENQINEWLDRFFKLRVSTNMLISQYLEICGAKKGVSSLELPCSGGRDEEELNPYQASINASCHPYRIARHAAEVIRKLCTQWYGFAPEIHVTDAGAKPFPFVPRYLFYILSELLKNSVRATVENSGFGGGVPSMPRNLEPVTVLVCSDPGVTSIRVSDEGGGIPVDCLSHVWSYLYTTAEPITCPRTREAVDAPTDLRRLETGSLSSITEAPAGWSSLTESDQDHSALLRSPLAGLGCGLPLSRLYAEYLGGEVKLHTLPRFGTDVFVYLNRLGDSNEEWEAL